MREKQKPNLPPGPARRNASIALGFVENSSLENYPKYSYRGGQSKKTSIGCIGLYVNMEGALYAARGKDQSQLLAALVLPIPQATRDSGRPPVKRQAHTRTKWTPHPTGRRQPDGYTQPPSSSPRAPTAAMSVTPRPMNGGASPATEAERAPLTSCSAAILLTSRSTTSVTNRWHFDLRTAQHARTLPAWMLDYSGNTARKFVLSATISEMAIYLVRAFRSGRGSCSTAHT